MRTVEPRTFEPSRQWLTTQMKIFGAFSAALALVAMLVTVVVVPMWPALLNVALVVAALIVLLYVLAVPSLRAQRATIDNDGVVESGRWSTRRVAFRDVRSVTFNLGSDGQTRRVELVSSDPDTPRLTLIGYEGMTDLREIIEANLPDSVDVVAIEPPTRATRSLQVAWFVIASLLCLAALFAWFRYVDEEWRELIVEWGQLVITLPLAAFTLRARPFSRQWGKKWRKWEVVFSVLCAGAFVCMLVRLLSRW